MCTVGRSCCPREPTWHPWTRPWGPDMAMQTWWGICWRMSRTSPPVVHPTGQILVRDAPWPSSTQCSVSGRTSRTSQPVVQLQLQLQLQLQNCLFTPPGKCWSETLHGHRPLRVQCLADSGQLSCLDVVDAWQMEGNQCYHLAIAPLQQA